MPVKMDKMQKAYEEAQKGDLWTPDEGETLLLVHPPCRDDDEHEPTDGLCYVPVVIHYSVGRGNAVVMCLDQKANPLIDHPFLREILKKRGVQLGDELECPVCKAIYEGRIAGDDAKDSRAQERWLWGITPISFSRKVGGSQVALPPEPTPYMCGWKVFNALMAAFSECGNITDFDSEVLFKLRRKGTTKFTTNYDGCGPDVATVKSPMKLDKSVRRLVREAMQPEGDCDLFNLAAGFVKSEAEAQAALTGIRVVKDEPDEPEPTGASGIRKSCYSKDCVDDDECRVCPDKDKCAAECNVPVPGKPAGPEAASKPAGPEAASKPAESEPEAAGEEVDDDDEAAQLRAQLDDLEKKLAATAGGKKGKGKK